ncbi:MAG: phosphatase, partial [Vallitaleaceae bacterium]|nr:phosphatase [Vallitaleaceae bacterium]
VNAAKSAGMACIGYDNISSKNQDISLADYQVKSIIEIVQNFESIMA